MYENIFQTVRVFPTPKDWSVVCVLPCLCPSMSLEGIEKCLTVCSLRHNTQSPQLKEERFIWPHSFQSFHTEVGWSQGGLGWERGIAERPHGMTCRKARETDQGRWQYPQKPTFSSQSSPSNFTFSYKLITGWVSHSSGPIIKSNGPIIKAHLWTQEGVREI